MKRRFTVELERVGKTATMFQVPFDLAEAFGRARPPGRASANRASATVTPSRSMAE
jgi:hypothetical protein